MCPWLTASEAFFWERTSCWAQTKMIYERFIIARILLNDLIVWTVNPIVKRARRACIVLRPVQETNIPIRQDITINITYVYHGSLATVAKLARVQTRRAEWDN